VADTSTTISQSFWSAVKSWKCLWQRCIQCQRLW